MTGERAELHFINVGHGTSTLVTTASGDTLLIDTGQRKVPSRPGETIDGSGPGSLDDLRLFRTHDSFVPEQYINSIESDASFFDIGDRIDHFAISHPHSDHQYYAPDIVETFDVGTVHTPGVPREWSESSLDLAEKLNKNNVNLNWLSAGDPIDIGRVEVKVIGPDAPPTPDIDLSEGRGQISRVSSKELNSNSLIINISNGDNNFVLPGDAPAPQIRDACREHGIKPNGVVGSHHLATDGNIVDGKLAYPTDNLQFVVGSYGDQSINYDLPNNKTLHTLQREEIPTFATRKNGCICVVSDQNSFDVYAERSTSLEPERLLNDSKESYSHPMPGESSWGGTEGMRKIYTGERENTPERFDADGDLESDRQGGAESVFDMDTSNIDQFEDEIDELLDKELDVNELDEDLDIEIESDRYLGL